MTGASAAAAARASAQLARMRTIGFRMRFQNSSSAPRIPRGDDCLRDGGADCVEKHVLHRSAARRDEHLMPLIDAGDDDRDRDAGDRPSHRESGCRWGGGASPPRGGEGAAAPLRTPRGAEPERAEDAVAGEVREFAKDDVRDVDLSRGEEAAEENSDDRAAVMRRE